MVLAPERQAARFVRVKWDLGDPKWVWSRQGMSPPKECVAAVWRAVAPVLAVSETCAWVSEVRAQK